MRFTPPLSTLGLLLPVLCLATLLPARGVRAQATFIWRQGQPPNSLNGLKHQTILVGMKPDLTTVPNVLAELSDPKTTLDDLWIYDHAELSISAGTISWLTATTPLHAFSSTITMTGGIVEGGPELFSSTLNFSGGTIDLHNRGVVGYGKSIINISAGTIGGAVITASNAIANISAGTFTGAYNVVSAGVANITGGKFLGKRFDSNGGTVNLVGEGFSTTFVGTSLGYFGEEGGLWNLTGTLADGEDLSGFQYWERGATGGSPQHLVFLSSIAPEPTSLALLSMALLPIAGMLYRRKLSDGSL